MFQAILIKSGMITNAILFLSHVIGLFVVEINENVVQTYA